MLYKIIRYDVLRESQDVPFFSEMVEDHLEDGWELVGSPFVFNGNIFCQAVIKK